MSVSGPIAVIGAGIAGVSTAVWLARSGANVILIDRQEPGDATSFGNGGVLAACAIVPVTVPGLMRKAPGMLMDPDSPLFLRWPYLPKLLPFLTRYLANCRADRVEAISRGLALLNADSLAQHQALAGGTEAERWLVPSDYVFRYPDRAAFEGDSFGWNLRRQAGFEWDEIEGAALADYDPLFSQQNSFAVRLKNHGRISDPGRYVKALAGHFLSLGGAFRRAEIHDFRIGPDGLEGLETSNGFIACGKAVLATGVWSKPLMAKLGLSVPLESERGYHLELIEPSAMPAAPTMMTSGKFVVTPMEGRIRLAGIVEFGGLDAGPSEAPFALLERQARAAMPGLTWRETSRWMGHRPAPADSLPLIGEVPGCRDVIAAFGHHHIGLTAGPKTGRFVSGMLTGQKTNSDLSAFDPARFA